MIEICMSHHAESGVTQRPQQRCVCPSPCPCAEPVCPVWRRRLQQIESEFYQHVDLRGAAAACGLSTEALDLVYNYWKLKRKVWSPNTLEEGQAAQCR